MSGLIKVPSHRATTKQTGITASNKSSAGYSKIDTKHAKQNIKRQICFPVLKKTGSKQKLNKCCIKNKHDKNCGVSQVDNMLLVPSKYRKSQKTIKEIQKTVDRFQALQKNQQQQLTILEMMSRLDKLYNNYDKIIQEDMQILGKSQIGNTRRIQQSIFKQKSLLNDHKQSVIDFVHLCQTKRSIASSTRNSKAQNKFSNFQRVKSLESLNDNSTIVSSSFQKSQSIETPTKNIFVRSKSQPQSKVILTYKSKLLVNGKQLQQKQ